MRRPNLIGADALPVHGADRHHLRLRRLRARARPRARAPPATTTCAPSRPGAARPATSCSSASASPCYVEVTAGPQADGKEFAKVEIDADGSATVFTGTSPHGQGHHTAFAMLASDNLGIPMDQIRVVHGDTDLVPEGEGTMGSRSLQLGGSAVQ